MAIDQIVASEQRTPNITKARIIKNLVLISISFLLLFTAYDGLCMLQSTMNKKAAVGVFALAAGYIAFCIAALLLPKYIIEKLGCKYSIFGSILLYVPYIAANFYPKWFIMIPTGVLSGISASILWGSQCTYFNESAVRYAELVEEERKRKLTSEFLSDRARVSIISVGNGQQDIPAQEDPSKREKPQTKHSELSIMKCKCKNVSCGNVDAFVVTEIAKSCVQYVNNAAENGNAPETNREINPDNLVLGENSTSLALPAQTHEKQDGISRNHVQDGAETSNEENRRQSVKSWNVSKLHSALPRRNSIFQRANTLESVTGLFFACHGMAYFSALIFSNVISYYVLKDDDVNMTRYLSKCACGAQFCKDNAWCISDDTEYVSSRVRYLLTTVSVIIALISAFLMLLFLDPLKKVKTDAEEVKESEQISFNLLLATIHQNKKKEQLCLIPLNLYEGMLEGFYTADFTESYVGCAWGASNVGLVSIFFGLACILSSPMSGCLVKYAGRKPLFLIGQVLTILMTIFLLLWKPDADSTYKFYIAAIFIGTIIGIYWSQLLAFYGLLFKKDEEAAFASYYLWTSVGWTLSFLGSPYLCTYVKIYILIAVSLLGTAGYFCTEQSYEKRKLL